MSPASIVLQHMGARRLQRRVLLVLIYAALFISIIYPMLMILYESVFAATEGFFEHVLSVVTDGDVGLAIVNTLKISILATMIAGTLGVALAWLVARTDMPFAKFLDPLNMLPFYLSSVVGALSWQVIASPKIGLLNKLLEPVFGPAPVFNVYSIPGIAFVLGLFYAPYIYLFTLESLRSMDASLEEAARMAGSSILNTAFKITLPLSAPAILSSFMLVFVTCAGIFGVPQVLGTPGHITTVSTIIYRAMNDYPADYPTAALLSVMLFLFTACLIVLQIRFMKNKSFATITGKGYRPRPLKLGKWRWFGFGVNVCYVVMILLPFVALCAVSLQDAWTGSFEWGRVTFNNYRAVLFVEDAAKRGLSNSLIISSVGASIAIAVCFFLALIVQKTKLPGRNLISLIATLPVAIPGIVLGLGFLVGFISTPLYGTIWIIMFAYIVHYLPTGLSNMEALVQSVSKELDESARMSGASWSEAMRKVLFPLLAPGMISTWILLFVTFIREVSASVMLYTLGTETLSIALIRIMEYKPYGISAAFGVLQTLLLMGAVVLLRFATTLNSDKKGGH